MAKFPCRTARVQGVMNQLPLVADLVNVNTSQSPFRRSPLSRR